MDSLAGLAGNLNVLCKSLSKNVGRAKQNVARAVLRPVVEGTPVDTGQARSNWIVSCGEEDENVIPPHNPYPKFSQANGAGISETANAQAAIAAGEAVIASCPDDQGIYISNNVDYIGMLNDGYSAQAPATFVEMAVAAGLVEAKKTSVIE